MAFDSPGILLAKEDHTGFLNRQIINTSPQRPTRTACFCGLPHLS